MDDLLNLPFHHNLPSHGGTRYVILQRLGIGGSAETYLVLAAAPGAARFLPRPGAWMETLRGIMGFLLAASAVWLLYVLAAQISPERLALFEDGLLLIALVTWLRHRAGAGARVVWSVRPEDATGRAVLLDGETSGPSPTLRLVAAPQSGAEGAVLLELPASATAGRVRGVRVELDRRLLPAVLALQTDPGASGVEVDGPSLAERTVWGSR